MYIQGGQGCDSGAVQIVQESSKKQQHELHFNKRFKVFQDCQDVCGGLWRKAATEMAPWHQETVGTGKKHFLPLGGQKRERISGYLVGIGTCLWLGGQVESNVGKE
jgi:hypothetical protein